MAFLIRRGKRAFAGWADSFDRPNENPVRKPWEFWGNVANFSLVNGRLKLAADGAPARGGNYDGGVAFEHQPLHEHWGFEFTRAPLGNTFTSTANNTKQNVFIDKNWTEGGNASTTSYQVALQLDSEYYPEEKDSEGKVTKSARQDRYVRILTRDKVNQSTVWFWKVDGSIGGDNVEIQGTPWAAALKIRVSVFSDRWIVVYINGKQELFADMYDPNFQFGPKKRSANFAQVSGLIASIDDFSTYDIPKTLMRTDWTEQHYDSFNRANSTTVENGWTQTAGNSWGIYSNALSMNGAFGAGGSDGFRQIRRDTGSTDMKVEFTIGGVGEGTSSPSDLTPIYILGRLSADGKRGLCVYIREKTFWLDGWSWNGALGSQPTLDGSPFWLGFQNAYLPSIARGTRFSLTISGDVMWLTNETQGKVTFYKEGMNAMVPDTSNNTWAGAVIMRNAFRNSVSVGEMRIYT